MTKKICQPNLRKIRKTDCETIWSWRNSDHVKKFMYDQKSISWADHQAWFDKILVSKKDIYWLIEAAKSEIGLACINDISQDNKRASWAFYIADKNFRAVGAGSAIEYMVADFAFNSLKLNRLSCEVLSWNTSIIRMHKKFGFYSEGVKRQYVFHDGQFIDVECFSITKTEWQINQKKNIDRLEKAGFHRSELTNDYSLV